MLMPNQLPSKNNSFWLVEEVSMGEEGTLTRTYTHPFGLVFIIFCVKLRCDKKQRAIWNRCELGVCVCIVVCNEQRDGLLIVYTITNRQEKNLCLIHVGSWYTRLLKPFWLLHAATSTTPKHCTDSVNSNLITPISLRSAVTLTSSANSVYCLL